MTRKKKQLQRKKDGFVNAEVLKEAKQIKTDEKIHGKLGKRGFYDRMEVEHVLDCMECGSCNNSFSKITTA